MDKFLVAPSTDPAKSDEELVKYVCELQGIADILHCDVMDGRFVGRKTINYDQIRRIRDTTTMFLDVHLMIEKPWLYVQKYAECGANLITVHYECFKENKQLLSCFEDIRNNGCLVGLSIKPDTQISEIKEYLNEIDLCLIMSVYPGKSGQTFIEKCYEKVNQLQQIKQELNLNLKIEVDGGVNVENAQKLKQLGANVIVSGSYVYNADNREEAINSLKNL